MTMTSIEGGEERVWNRSTRVATEPVRGPVLIVVKQLQGAHNIVHFEMALTCNSLRDFAPAGVWVLPLALLARHGGWARNTLVLGVWLVPLDEVKLCADKVDPVAVPLPGDNAAVQRLVPEERLVVGKLGNAVRHRLQVVVSPQDLPRLQIDAQLRCRRHVPAGALRLPHAVVKLRRAQGNAQHLDKHLVNGLGRVELTEAGADLAPLAAVHSKEPVLGDISRWDCAAVRPAAAHQRRRTHRLPANVEVQRLALEVL